MKKILQGLLFFASALLSLNSYSQSLGNNTCATAVSIPTTGACVSGNNNTATSTGDGTATCFTVENGVWFKFVAPASGVVDITTSDVGTNFDSQLTLYSGACGSLVELACDDQSGALPNSALIHYECLVPGQTYYVMLDGYAGATGNFCIKITTPIKPINDYCSCATIVPINGTCLGGQTTVGATDNWTGIVGCQSGNNPEVWYTFVADSSSVTFTVTAGTLGGSVEMVLGTANSCASTFSTHSTYCSGSPASHTFLNLTIGATYYLTISSSGAAGTFTICGLSSTPPPVAGQDCFNAANLCSNAPFGQASSSAGFGTQEVTPSNSCWGTGGERQSKWYKFTAGTNGTLAFEIKPNVNTDDYDWALWDITTLGCPTTANTNPAIACNWWGTLPPNNDVEGSTGLSTYTTAATICASQPGAVDNSTVTAGCQPYSFLNQTSSTYGPLNVIAGHTYALLIDNFTTSNNGFSFIFGGTAHIGPVADFLTLKSCTAATLICAPSTSNMAYAWNFGDGATSVTSYSVAHTYTATGTYSTSLVVTDALGCTASYNSDLSIGSPSLVVSPTQTICAGESATIQATADPANPQQVAFTNTTSVAIPDNNAAGVNSTINVSGISPATIGANPMVRVCLNITHTWDSDVQVLLTCPSGNTIALTASNGGSGDNYSNTCFTGLISNPIDAATAPSNPPFTGYYQSQTNFSNLNGCNINGNWVLNVKDLVSGDVGTLNNWSMTFNTTSTAVNYTWSPSASLSAINSASTVATPTATTIYTVVAQDLQGCSVTGTTQVVVNPLPTPTITATNSVCLNSSLTFTGSGASTYTWSAGGTGGLGAPLTSSTVAATPTATGNITYTLTVTGANSCTNTATKTITVNPIPVANAGTSGTLTCSTKTLGLSGSGGGTYSWTGPGITSGSATATPSVNLPGTYSLTVTSAAGCTSTVSTVTVPQNTTAPTPGASNSTTLSCTTTTAVLTGTGGGTYSWAGPGVISGGATATPTVNTGGTFTVTVTAANGCTATANTTVSQNTIAPTPGASNSTTLSCTTTTAVLTGTGGGTYSWAGPGVISGGATATPTVNTPGTFTVTVTAANGCTATANTTVSQNTTAPTPGASNSTTLSCTTTTAVLTGTGGGTYSWAGPGVINGGATATPTVNTPGTFTVTVTAANGCTATANTTVSQNTTAPTPGASNSTTLSCTTTTAVLTGTGGGTYSWAGPGVINGGATATPTVNTPGTFTVTVTAANGCTATANTTVSQNTTAPTPGASNSTTLSCTTTTAVLTGTGGGTYSWAGPGVINGGATATPTVNTPGTFTVTVTAANGCTATANTTVSQNTTAPTPSILAPAQLNCTLTSTSLSGSPGAGVTYTWTGPGTITNGNTANPTINTPGTFSLAVTSTSNGCVGSTTTSVTQNTVAPNVTMPGTQTITCAAPTVTMVASANPSTCTPVWTGGVASGVNSYTATASSPNTYTLTVTNPANGCTAFGTTQVAPSAGVPVVSTSATNSLSCSSLTAQVVASTTMSPVSYTWTGPGITAGANTASATVNAQGQYTVVVTNTMSSCSSTVTIGVTQNTTSPTVTPNVPAILTCTTTTVTASATTSTTPVSYTWTGVGITSGAGTGTVSINQPGTYGYTVTNTSNNCPTSGTIAVTQNTVLPTVTMPASQTITCGAPTVTMVASANPSTCTPVWTGGVASGAGSYTATATSANVYTLTVTNPANGCTNFGTTQVSPSAGFPNVVTSTTNSISCTSTTAQVVATTTSSPVSYAWSGPGIVSGATTPSATVNAGGQYTVIVTNTLSACSVTLNTSVTANTTAITPTVSFSGSVTCTTPTITVASSPSAGVTYTWTGGIGLVSNPNNQNADIIDGSVYTLSVTNTVNNCVGSTTVSVPVNTVVPTVTLSPASYTTTCATPTVQLSVTTNPAAGVSYSWTSPATGSLDNTSISNPVANGSGIFTLEVTNNSNGCTTATGQNTLEIIPDAGVPTVSVSATSLSITCTNTLVTSAITSTNTTLNYTWSPVPVTGGANPEFDAQGTYNATITASNGCSTFATINVALDNTSPTISITPNQTLTCNNPSVTISTTVAPTGLSYTWAGPSIVGANNGTSVDVNGVGDYTVSVLNTSNGCSVTATSSVNVNNTTPTITVVSSSTVISCATSTVSLNASSTTTDTPVWSTTTGTLSNPMIANTAGDYTISVVDQSNGCSASQVITLTGNTTAPNANANASSPIPCGATTVALLGTSTSTNVSYAWSGPGVVSGSNTATPIINQTGIYTMTVTDLANGCTSTVTTNVTQGNVLADFTADPTSGIAPLSVNFTNNSVGATTYNWTFGDGNSSTAQNTSNVFGNTGTYTVTLIASSGTCADTAYAVITVEDGLTLYIPNVFTPNNDGVNDLFTIKSTGVKDISLQIFNRWGEKLYEFAGDRAAWDGKVGSGASVPEGTYFYFVKATGFDGKEIEQHGSVNLFR